VFHKQAACKRLASMSFHIQLLGKLLVQQWHGSSADEFLVLFSKE